MKENSQEEIAAGALMTQRQVARYLSISVAGAGNLDIPRVRLGERRHAYLKADVDAWVESHREAGGKRCSTSTIRG